MARHMIARTKSHHSKTLGLISLGCPKNTVDSERLLGELEDSGWTFTDDIHDADCLVVNTCGFINDARLESEEALNEIINIKKNRQDVILVATGCLPQREGIDLRKKFPELDLVIGVGSLEKLPGMLEVLWQGKTVRKTNERELIAPGRATLSASNTPRLLLTPPWTAYMKIAEGCSHECAFCTIPLIKGPHESRPIGDLVNEAGSLASVGIKELIIISQDTTAYGSDIGTNIRNLLGELDQVDGIEWIRLHYLYPSKISGGLLDTIAGSRHIIPYFDIPVQHVSPDILRAMNRLAPDTDISTLIKQIRERFSRKDIPACIRSTVIVGFPGENEEDFVRLLNFMESSKIDRLTVFQYSPEEGTTAIKFPDQVPKRTAEDRMHQIMEIQREISFEIQEEWVGREIDVLLEGETDDGRRVGRTYRDAPEIDGLAIVGLVPEEIEAGTIIKARVTSAFPYDIEAEYLEIKK